MKPHTSHQQMYPLVATKLTRHLAPGSFPARIFATAAALLAMTVGAFAAADKTVTLAWNANPETNIAGYRLRFGTTSGSYSNTVEAGTSLSATATGLDGGTTYYFAVVAYSSSGQTSPSSAEVTYTVPGVPNQAPVATALSLVTAEDTDTAATLSATDPEGDPITYSIVSPPTKGTLVGTAPNLTYRPAANANGSDSFTYRASDGPLNSATVTASISITPVSDAPLANSTGITTAEDVNLAFVLSASDPDGGTLVYTILTAPAKGTLTGSPPNLTYRPTAHVNGSDSFTFKVGNGSLESGVATVSVTITPVNDLPVANAQSVGTMEDTPLAITLAGADVEGSNLSYAVVTPPGKGSLSGTPPNVTYIPALNSNGADSFTFRVNDGAANSANATVNIAVTPVNDAPVASSTAISAILNNSVAATLSASDPDGNPLTYTLVSSPAHGTLTGTAPGLTYHPAAAYLGSDSLSFKVSDGTLESGVATVSISVIQGNAIPVALAQSVTATEDTARSITLTGTDQEGGPLTFAIVTQPANGTFSGTPPNLTYTPKLNFSGSDSFTFRVNDGSVNSTAATVSISVAAVNDAPVATPRTVSAPKNGSVSVVLSGTDVDGGPLTYTLLTAPANGVLSGAIPNLTYRPTPGFTGGDSFSFRVNDGTVNSAAATVAISVSGTANTPPNIHHKQAVTLVNKPVKLLLTGHDPDSDPMTFRIATQPANGTLAGTPPNLVYRPKRGYKGADSFTFVGNDGKTDSGSGTVTINVKAKNVKPVATPAALVANMNSQTAITLAGTDVDGEQVTCSIVAKPKNGTISGTSPNFVYVPKPGFKGKDAFTFRVSDGIAFSAVALVQVKVVNPNNRAPVVVSKTISTNVNKAVAVVLEAGDADGDALTYRLLSRPAVGRLGGKRAPNFFYKPVKGFVGTVTLTYVANDLDVDSATATITIHVVDPARSITATQLSKSGASEPPLLPSLTLAGDPAREGGLLLQVRGKPGGNWMLKHSPDLKEWLPQGPVLIGEEGVVTLQLMIPEGSRCGFYRIESP